MTSAIKGESATPTDDANDNNSDHISVGGTPPSSSSFTPTKSGTGFSAYDPQNMHYLPVNPDAADAAGTQLPQKFSLLPQQGGLTEAPASPARLPSLTRYATPPQSASRSRSEYDQYAADMAAATFAHARIAFDGSGNECVRSQSSTPSRRALSRAGSNSSSAPPHDGTPHDGTPHDGGAGGAQPHGYYRQRRPVMLDGSPQPEGSPSAADGVDSAQGSSRGLGAGSPSTSSMPLSLAAAFAAKGASRSGPPSASPSPTASVAASAGSKGTGSSGATGAEAALSTGTANTGTRDKDGESQHSQDETTQPQTGRDARKHRSKKAVQPQSPPDQDQTRQLQQQYRQQGQLPPLRSDGPAKPDVLAPVASVLAGAGVEADGGFAYHHETDDDDDEGHDVSNIDDSNVNTNTISSTRHKRSKSSVGDQQSKPQQDAEHTPSGSFLLPALSSTQSASQQLLPLQQQHQYQAGCGDTGSVSGQMRALPSGNSGGGGHTRSHSFTVLNITDSDIKNNGADIHSKASSLAVSTPPVAAVHSSAAIAAAAVPVSAVVSNTAPSPTTLSATPPPRRLPPLGALTPTPPRTPPQEGRSPHHSLSQSQSRSTSLSHQSKLQPLGLTSAVADAAAQVRTTTTAALAQIANTANSSPTQSMYNDCNSASAGFIVSAPIIGTKLAPPTAVATTESRVTGAGVSAEAANSNVQVDDALASAKNDMIVTTNDNNNGAVASTETLTQAVAGSADGSVTPARKTAAVHSPKALKLPPALLTPPQPQSLSQSQSRSHSRSASVTRCAVAAALGASGSPTANATAVAAVTSIAVYPAARPPLPATPSRGRPTSPPPLAQGHLAGQQLQQQRALSSSRTPSPSARLPPLQQTPPRSQSGSQPQSQTPSRAASQSRSQTQSPVKAFAADTGSPSTPGNGVSTSAGRARRGLLARTASDCSQSSGSQPGEDSAPGTPRSRVSRAHALLDMERTRMRDGRAATVERVRMQRRARDGAEALETELHAWSDDHDHHSGDYNYAEKPFKRDTVGYDDAKTGAVSGAAMFVLSDDDSGADAPAAHTADRSRPRAPSATPSAPSVASSVDSQDSKGPRARAMDAAERERRRALRKDVVDRERQRRNMEQGAVAAEHEGRVWTSDRTADINTTNVTNVGNSTVNAANGNRVLLDAVIPANITDVQNEKPSTIATGLTKHATSNEFNLSANATGAVVSGGFTAVVLNGEVANISGDTGGNSGGSGGSGENHGNGGEFGRRGSPSQSPADPTPSCSSASPSKHSNQSASPSRTATAEDDVDIDSHTAKIDNDVTSKANASHKHANSNSVTHAGFHIASSVEKAGVAQNAAALTQTMTKADMAALFDLAAAEAFVFPSSDDSSNKSNDDKSAGEVLVKPSGLGMAAVLTVEAANTDGLLAIGARSISIANAAAAPLNPPALAPGAPTVPCHPLPATVGGILGGVCIADAPPLLPLPISADAATVDHVNTHNRAVIAASVPREFASCVVATAALNAYNAAVERARVLTALSSGVVSPLLADAANRNADATRDHYKKMVAITKAQAKLDKRPKKHEHDVHAESPSKISAAPGYTTPNVGDSVPATVKADTPYYTNNNKYITGVPGTEELITYDVLPAEVPGGPQRVVRRLSSNSPAARVQQAQPHATKLVHLMTTPVPSAVAGLHMAETATSGAVMDADAGAARVPGILTTHGVVATNRRNPAIIDSAAACDAENALTPSKANHNNAVNTIDANPPGTPDPSYRHRISSGSTASTRTATIANTRVITDADAAADAHAAEMTAAAVALTASNSTPARTTSKISTADDAMIVANETVHASEHGAATMRAGFDEHSPQPSISDVPTGNVDAGVNRDRYTLTSGGDNESLSSKTSTGPRTSHGMKTSGTASALAAVEAGHVHIELLYGEHVADGHTVFATSARGAAIIAAPALRAGNSNSNAVTDSTPNSAEDSDIPKSAAHVDSFKQPVDSTPADRIDSLSKYLEHSKSSRGFMNMPSSASFPAPTSVRPSATVSAAASAAGFALAGDTAMATGAGAAGFASDSDAAAVMRANSDDYDPANTYADGPARANSLRSGNIGGSHSMSSGAPSSALLAYSQLAQHGVGLSDFASPAKPVNSSLVAGSSLGLGHPLPKPWSPARTNNATVTASATLDPAFAGPQPSASPLSPPASLESLHGTLSAPASAVPNTNSGDGNGAVSSASNSTSAGAAGSSPAVAVGATGSERDGHVIHHKMHTKTTHSDHIFSDLRNHNNNASLASNPSSASTLSSQRARAAAAAATAAAMAALEAEKRAAAAEATASARANEIAALKDKLGT